MAYKSNIPREQRIILGCKANIGIKVSELAEECHTNRQFIYTQMEKVHEVLNQEFDIPLPVAPCVTVDKSFIQRVILGCMVLCKGSTGNAQELVRPFLNLLRYYALN